MTLTFFLKFFGAVFTISGAGGYGFWLAARYRQRLRELEQVRQMMFLLKGQILYANAPLAEAFDAVGRRTSGWPSQLFLAVSGRIERQQGESFYQIWKEETERLKDLSAVSDPDRHSLILLGEHLGFLDRDMQERTLLLYLEQLDEQIGQMREHRQERCRLYSSLGIMGGVFLSILLL